MPRIFTDIDDTILKDGQPVERVIDFIDETAEEVVILTNRPESDREKTVADLAATGLVLCLSLVATGVGLLCGPEQFLPWMARDCLRQLLSLGATKNFPF